MSTENYIADAICSHFIRCVHAFFLLLCRGNVSMVKVRPEGENATEKEEKNENYNE